MPEDKQISLSTALVVLAIAGLILNLLPKPLGGVAWIALSALAGYLGYKETKAISSAVWWFIAAFFIIFISLTIMDMIVGSLPDDNHSINDF
jgi:hypothetical protein